MIEKIVLLSYGAVIIIFVIAYTIYMMRGK